MIDRSMILRRFPLLETLQRDGVKVIGQGVQRMAKCPLHADKNPSMSINVERQTFYCHGCAVGGSVIDYIAKRDKKSIDDVLRELSQKLERTTGTVRSLQSALKTTSAVMQALRTTVAQPVATPLVSNGEKLGTLVCSYNYEGPTGKVLYRVNRYDPKDFRQQHLVGDKWVWGMQGVERVLYHLPEVLASGDKPVWMCFAPDTELLTPTGWRPIADCGDTVAQYEQGTETISLVKPRAAQEFQFMGDCIQFKHYFCELLVTPDHRMLVDKTGHGRLTVLSADAVRGHFRLPTSGLLKDWQSSLSVECVRLVAAFQADGVITNWHRRKVGEPTAWQHPGWNLKKERKKIRLRQLLNAVGIEFKETVCPSAPGYTLFTIRRKDFEWA